MMEIVLMIGQVALGRRLRQLRSSFSLSSLYARAIRPYAVVQRTISAACVISGTLDIGKLSPFLRFVREKDREGRYAKRNSSWNRNLTSSSESEAFSSPGESIHTYGEGRKDVLFTRLRVLSLQTFRQMAQGWISLKQTIDKKNVTGSVAKRGGCSLLHQVRVLTQKKMSASRKACQDESNPE